MLAAYHPQNEVDTARTYCEGTSEEYLGKLNAAARGFKIETKLFPRKVKKYVGFVKHSKAEPDG